MIFTNFRWQDAAGGHTGQSCGEMKAKGNPKESQILREESTGRMRNV